MAQYVPINQASDTIITTDKVTKGLFTGDVGVLDGSNFTTKSLSTTQKKFYYNMQYSSEDQFSVTYGHRDGSGSALVTNITGETEGIYRQIASLVLDSDKIKHGIQFTSGTLSNDVYALFFERARMKDRMNRKNWTLTLSGSLVTTGSHTELTGSITSVGKILLTDDSDTTTFTATPGGPRYNIYSGSAGTVNTTATKYGWAFPNLGLLLLDADVLSSSMPGTTSYVTGSGTDGLLKAGNGFAQDTSTDGTADNAIKFVKAIQLGSMRFRSEEDQTSTSYFCRALANDFNFTSNPSFTSGSTNVLSVPSMLGNPSTFITTVGLYNGSPGAGGDLVAVGRLSAPVKKSRKDEVTIKVNLTY